MIACLDVAYANADRFAVAAAVAFADWADERPLEEAVARVGRVLPYVPGRFFERELPVLLAGVGALSLWPDVVVVDGHVWLRPGEPGLGAHLHHALSGPVVVGVAKRPFRGGRAIEVWRGASKSPLYVTAAGIADAEAADWIRRMHGPHRVPSLLRRADRLCREGLIALVGSPRFPKPIPDRAKPRSLPAAPGATAPPKGKMPTSSPNGAGLPMENRT